MSQGCPGDSLRCISVVSASDYSNLSPSSSPLQKERIREKFVAALQREFAGKGLRFSRGE